MNQIVSAVFQLRSDNIENKYVCVTVHTAGRDEEHADEDVLQNNSL